MSVRPEVVLLLGAGGVGLLALLFPLLLRHNDPPAPRSWARLILAAAAIVVLFGLTRLSSYPFAPGGTLGNGLLLGGGIALITVALAAFWPGTAATAVGASGGALLGGTLTLLWHRGYPDAALVGFGAGHAVATLLATGGEDEQDDPDGTTVGPSGLWAGPVMAALLAGAVYLAIARAEQLSAAERLALDGKVWWVWPAAALAAALAGQMIGLSLFSRRGWAPAGAGLVSALILLLLWLRFPRYAPLLGPMAAGFVTGFLLLLLTGREPGLREWAGGNWSLNPPVFAVLPALVAPAVVLLLLAAAYRLYTGYGIALAALGTAVLLPWLAEREPRALGRALFGLLAASILFRVFYQNYGLRDNDIPLTAHYAMLGLLTGALAPFALGVLQATGNRRQGADRSSAVALFLSPAAFCLLAVGLPLLLALFWGEKVGGGFLLGGVIGQGYRMMAGLLEAEAPGRMGVVAGRVPEATLLVSGWVTVQILNWAAQFGLQLLRVQRIAVIAALAILCVVAVLVRASRRPDARH